jgi:hypothetical protein
LNLIQYNRGGFVKYSITDLHLKIIEVRPFKFSRRYILLDNIDMSALDRERVKDSFFFMLGFISSVFFFYFLEEIASTGLWPPPKRYALLLSVSGCITLLFFLLWIFAPFEIHIGVHDDKMIKLYEKRPSKKKVNDFLRLLEKEISIGKAKTQVMG